MKFVGAHVSISGGVYTSPARARNIGANAFGIFTRNQRRWTSKALSDADASLFKEEFAKSEISLSHILPHAGYLINLGTPNKETAEKSRVAFLDEFSRCYKLGLSYLNFHPGSHLNKIDAELCMDEIARQVNLAIKQVPNVIAVYESTAGQGSNLGYTFEQLSELIERIDDKSRVGICLDTCHMHAAGYDITTDSSFASTMDKFDKIVGVKFLKGVHLNDSKTPLGSRIDRHENLGKGTMGWEPFRLLMNDNRFDEIPLILETADEELWAEEIKELFSLID